MNFKEKKKKGSSLLIVVAMMAVISIITISVLTMTTSGYSMRKESNKRVESFYGADSGLEISERILIGFIEAAIDSSNKYIDTDEVAKETIDEKNKIFKEKFIKFFQEGGTSDIKPFYEEGSTLTLGALDYSPVTDEIKLEDYYNILDREDIEIYESTLSYQNEDEKFIKSDDYSNIDKMIVTAKSRYKKDDKVREVGVDFEIEVPDYGKEVEKENGENPPRILDYIIGVDGDFTLNIGTSADFYGDIWVKGNAPNRATIDDKYTGGVKIATSGITGPQFEINGGIATGGTLNIEDIAFNIQNSAKKDIYANNVKLDNIRTGHKNSMNLNSKSLYVYNDLILNGESNKLSAKNYYGLNDINEYEESDFDLSEADRSSSIIINTDLNTTETKIDIEKDAYILGTSYIDMTEGSPYQTGQSNTVNNFSKPYTVRSDGKYIYDYNGNLHLIESEYDGDELDVEDKVEIVKEYKDSMTDLEKRMSDRLVANEFYNTGVIYGRERDDDGKLEDDYIILPNMPDGDDVNELQTEYAKEVFNMGEEGSDISQFWNKEFGSSVEDSFKWEEFPDVINNLNPDKATLVAKNEDSTIGVFDTNLTIGQIIHKAHHDPMEPDIRAYGAGHGESCNNENTNADFTDFDKYKARILLLSGDGKKLIINEVDANFSGDLIDEDGNKIVYNLKPDHDFLNGVYDKYPLLVISESDVVMPEIKNKNYVQVITAGSFTMNTSDQAGILGNYAVQSQNVGDYEEGQYNFLNELYKYILLDTDILGNIGDDIFEGEGFIEVTESVEISDIIQTENWNIIR